MNLPILSRTHLDGLMVFLAVADHGGFRAAARHLGISASAVSQGIRTLEVRTGAPLFVRTTRSVGLTEAGERLLTQVRPAVRMLSDGLDAAAGLGNGVSGLLRINLPRAVMPLLANRLLPAFLEQHPQLKLELHGEDRLVDIVKEGFDAGIRLGNLVQADMVAQRLTPPLRFVVAATPALLQRAGRPRQPYDLEGLPCVGWRGPHGALGAWEFRIDGEVAKVDVDGPLIVNDAEMNLRAALRGVGLAWLPRIIAMPYLRMGLLESVLDDYAIERPGLSLYYPSRSQSLPRLRAFAQFAVEHMRQEFTMHDFLPVPCKDAA